MTTVQPGNDDLLVPGSERFERLPPSVKAILSPRWQAPKPRLIPELPPIPVVTAGKKEKFEKLCAERAEAFYKKAVEKENERRAAARAQKEEEKARAAAAAAAEGGEGEGGSPRAAVHVPLTENGTNGNSPLPFRQAIGKVADERTPMWDRMLSLKGTTSGAERMADLRQRFRTCHLEALEAADALTEETRKANLVSQQRARAHYGGRRQAIARATEAERTLREQARGIWDQRSSPAWGKRTTPAWGGLGYQYSLSEGDDARLRRVQQQQVEAMTAAFDERAEVLLSSGQKLLRERGTHHVNSKVLRREMNDCLAGLRLNRWTQQPLRLDTNLVSPRRGYIKTGPHEEWSKPLAVASRSGTGPLVPVYERAFETDVVADEEPEPEPEVEWTLFGSIWGPRCESCDGCDFVDHEDIIFKRFASDWQVMVRLGGGKLIAKSDDGANDAAEEVEEVGTVLLFNHQLCTLAYLWFADAVYSSSGDLNIGVKLNQGWKAFIDECKIWEHMSEKDAACANSLIFMQVDRADRSTIAAIGMQPKYQGRDSHRTVGQAGQHTKAEVLTAEGLTAAEADMELAAHSSDLRSATQAALQVAESKQMAKKSDSQLNRVEFMYALVKTAIERFVKTKELVDASEAVERLFIDHIQPSLEQPRRGRKQPRIPLPDTFRMGVCYKDEMSKRLAACAPSLRVIFAGLSKLTYEDARTAGVKLPKPVDNRWILREQGAVKWLKVDGQVSFPLWRRFLEGLFSLSTLDLRSITLCFQYSIMAVADGNSEEGRLKEQHLTFESFLEAIVRLATRLPLPTDAQLAASGHSRAGPFVAALDLNQEELKALAAQQACEWGDAPNTAVAGSMPTRIGHLVDVIVHRIRQPSGQTAPVGGDEASDGPFVTLTRRELRRWALRAIPGCTETTLPETWAAETKMLGETDALPKRR